MSRSGDQSANVEPNVEAKPNQEGAGVAAPAGARGQAGSTDSDAPVQLAVFDFDGTSIDGNSPVLLVAHLMKLGLLRKRVVSRILLWAAAYKLRLPQNEARVRGLVFTAFEGWPAKKVDTFLADFYDHSIAPIFRPQADAAMRAHAEAGDVVLVVSATFEPIILRAMEHHPFAYQVSTRMCVAPDGTYERRVEGLPVEGEEKLAAVQRFGDEHFGPGKWELAAAYGDHHSDRVVLGAAKRAFAVTPDRPLTRTARACGWSILNW
ncbi:HAD family hydrolase [Paraeggerthella hongkongensis]|uniref:HAD-IB family hydrolase n=1 Tax=Paraeggerthella hongkongensis TaxID=230658 RepID=A0A3N0B6L0_9ACTN|nr:HAD-IB family hydrolase [Paraeggerthella hongkongensis]RNL42540.1 HAD-IB family hydrolase [Paraeggerthella hongkongensis]